MKKFGLILTVLLTGCSLVACGNSSSKKGSSRKNATSKVVKHHKKSKKKANSKKQSNSSSSIANGTNSSQGRQPNNNGQQTQASANGQLPPASDLHDFVNRYGESPAAYLSDHYGMSPEQAVQSVPNNMKSSGEIQDTIMLQQGKDPFK
ncbi:hypothetical protein [Limosilactobacillus secaliphilus]|uniref:Lipoprotein n=1 Tax=Limosilactobacillus secaliphilus TaxID=396268 RepID=A0A0R2I2R7_9LACO|nr:hypothetical protein [Limosilactobacillus secaliphilus]KRN59473.1 hypothetical protein IV45_GL001217 [Limosilactobacillus secaliphilus]